MEFSVADVVVRVSGTDEGHVLSMIERRLTAGQGFGVATLNLDHLVKLESDAGFRAAYAAHDIITADGNPIVWMARVAGQRVALLPGSDLIVPALRVAARVGVAVAFVGSTQDSLDAAANTLTLRVPGLDVRRRVAPPMGFNPDGPEAAAILDDLAAQGVGLVFVALGAPKQERFAALGRRLHPSMGFLSIGAGLDFVSGAQHRAPVWVRKMALEWLWRAALDPKRLAKRYALSAAVLPKHAWRSLTARRDRPVRVAVEMVTLSAANRNLFNPSNPAAAEEPRRAA